MRAGPLGQESVSKKARGEGRSALAVEKCSPPGMCELKFMLGVRSYIYFHLILHV